MRFSSITNFRIAKAEAGYDLTKLRAVRVWSQAGQLLRLVAAYDQPCLFAMSRS